MGGNWVKNHGKKREGGHTNVLNLQVEAGPWTADFHATETNENQI